MASRLWYRAEEATITIIMTLIELELGWRQAAKQGACLQMRSDCGQAKVT